MTLEQVEQSVELRNTKVDVPYVKDPGFNMCKSFIDKNPINTIHDFLKLDIYDCVKCIYYVNTTTEKTPEECSDFIDEYKAYFEEYSSEDFEEFICMLYSIARYDSKDDIIKYILEKNPLKKNMLFAKFIFSGNEENRSYLFKEFLDDLSKEQQKVNIVKLINTITEDGEGINDCFALINVHKSINLEKEEIELIIKEMDTPRMKRKEKQKMLKSIYAENYKIGQIKEDLSVITKFVLNIEQEEREHLRKSTSEIKRNKYALSLLKEQDKEKEITEVKKIIKLLKDDTLKGIFLRYIYEHNMEYYKELEEEYEHIEKNSKLAYYKLLSKNDINSTDEDLNYIMLNSIEDLSLIIQYVKKLNLKNEEIIYILKNTTLDITRKLNEYISNEIISSDLVRDNLDFYDKESSKISLLDKGINIIKNFSLNPMYFKNYFSYFLTHIEIIEKNLKILENYNLLKNIKFDRDLSFIIIENLDEKIDKYLELGYYELLDRDIELLNLDHIKRLDLLKSMNMVIDEPEQLKEILTKDKFVISDDEIDNYILNALLYTKADNSLRKKEELEEFRESDLLYKIGDVLISVNKVNRKLDEGHTLYDALIYNLNLSNEEADSFNNALSKKVYNKQ